MLKEQRLCLLVSLKLSGEATIDELQELDVLIQQNPDLFQYLEVFEGLWKGLNERSVEKVERAFDKHLERLNNQVEPAYTQYEPNESVMYVPEVGHDRSGKKYRKLWWFGMVAASLLLVLIFLGASTGNEHTTSKSAGNIVSTKPGFKANINLPDGSQVWLNADSKITYSGDFQGKIREVYLSGEAFFDIAKDKTRPFIIHTKTIDLKVLGTSFNVRSYDIDKETVTALVHGSIEVVLRNNPDKKIILKPGEKLVVKNTVPENSIEDNKPDNNREEQPIAVLSKMHYYGEDSSSVEASWTKNRLSFDKEYLDEIAVKLERWYDIKVIIKDDRLTEEKYTAFFKNESLEEVMEALKLTGSFHYTIKNKEVVISR